MFFEYARWERAIAKGVDKDIRKLDLIQLCSEDNRMKMYDAIREGRYLIAPPHTAYIPKDDGTDRTVYVNEPADRILLSIANDILFELCPEMIHPTCKSYQKGIGCGRVVQEVSRRIVAESERVGGESPVVGWKADFTKYFDRVPIKYIDAAFDEVERKHGHSALIDVLRKYYHQDLYYDTREKEFKSQYQALKQGCAVASWLANVIMYDLDCRLSAMNGMYIRYCDDTLFIGPDYAKAMADMEQTMRDMSTDELNMEIKEKKKEYIDRTHWFKFLGFSIKGESISLSGSRIKTFQREIEARTISITDIKPKEAIRKVMRYLYVGDGNHAWATQVLPVINVQEDINELNNFAMDAIRATMTGRRKIGGLGFVKEQRKGRGCISRGRGRNVRSNRAMTPEHIEGFHTLQCMKNVLKYNKAVYRSMLVAA